MSHEWGNAGCGAPIQLGSSSSLEFLQSTEVVKLIITDGFQPDLLKPKLFCHIESKSSNTTHSGKSYKRRY